MSRYDFVTVRQLHQGHHRLRGGHALRGRRRLQLRRARRAPRRASRRGGDAPCGGGRRTSPSRSRRRHRRLRVRLAELDADAARVPDRERRRAHPVRQGRRRPDRPASTSTGIEAHTFLITASIRGEVSPATVRAMKDRCAAPRARRAGLRARRDARGPPRLRGLAGTRTRARHDRHPEDRRRRGGIPDRHRRHPRGGAHPRRARPARDRADAQGRPARARGRQLPRGGVPSGRAARPQRPRRHLRRLVCVAAGSRRGSGRSRRAGPRRSRA